MIIMIIFKSFKMKMYQTLAITFGMWIFAFYARDLFISIRYYMNPDNWVLDTSSYLIVGFPLLVITMIVVLYEVLQAFKTDGLKSKRLWGISIVAYIFFYFLMQIFAPKVLSTEIQPMDYQRITQQYKVSSPDSQRTLAMMLQSDCKITILEQNSAWVLGTNNKFNNNQIINLNQCKTTNKSKQHLLDLLVESHKAL